MTRTHASRVDWENIVTIVTRSEIRNEAADLECDDAFFGSSQPFYVDPRLWRGSERCDDGDDAIVTCAPSHTLTGGQDPDRVKFDTILVSSN